jgi:hypothetical protein
VLRVHSGATGLWTVELLFDRTGTPYLANGWRRFCQRHEIVVGHFVVLNYDGEHQIMVSVFNQTMCRRHYVAAARGKAVVSSSSEDDQQPRATFFLVLMYATKFAMYPNNLQC